MKENIIIVVPIYKDKPSDIDIISIDQLFKILGNYKIAFIAPKSLDAKLYSKWAASITRFDDKFFDGLKGYTNLLLSEFFYKEFSNYKYMLVYQTDAFVFADRLEEFCKLDYDYIGAPVRDFGWYKFHVGNGGLSLRKISACLSILKHKDEIVSLMDDYLREYLYEAEDLFWGYCGWRKDIAFSVPNIWVASKFSVERDVGHGLRNIQKDGLPFGCHHWNIMNRKVWKPYIEKYGYIFPTFDDDGWETLETDRIIRADKFMHYLMRHHKLSKKDVLEEKKYSIYGAGADGKRCIEELKRIGVDFKCVYDKKYDQLDSVLGIPVYELKEIDNDELIIIASSKYETQIINELKEKGLREKHDFKTYGEVWVEMRNKMEKLYSGIEGITKSFMV